MLEWIPQHMILLKVFQGFVIHLTLGALESPILILSSRPYQVSVLCSWMILLYLPQYFSSLRSAKGYKGIVRGVTYNGLAPHPRGKAML